MKSKIEKIKVPLKNNTQNKLSHDLLLKQLQVGLDVETRTVYLEDTIDVYTPTLLHARANTVFNMSGDRVSPINLHISCYGGDAYGMLGVWDIMNMLNVPVYTTGIGAIMSAAALILLYGEKGHRLVGRESVIMLHQISAFLTGSFRDIINEAKHITYLQGKMLDVLADKTNQKKSFWESRMDKNLYFTSEEAIELGIIDGII